MSTQLVTPDTIRSHGRDLARLSSPRGTTAKLTTRLRGRKHR